MGYTLSLLSLLLLTTVFRSLATLVPNHDDSLADELDSDIDHSSYRLPKKVLPVSYDLWIHTRLGVNDFTYQGHVNVTLKITDAVDVIVLHNDGLIIHKENLSLRYVGEINSTAIPIESQRSDEKRQFYILSFAIKLKPGVYLLEVPFEGEVRDDVFGFYRSSYVENEETKYVC